MFSDQLMTSGWLRAVARTLIGAVLLSQLAVSVHACPGWPSVLVQTVAQTATDGAVARADDGAGGGAATPAGAPAEVGAAPPHAHCAALAPAIDRHAGAPTPADVSLCAEHCQPGQQNDQAATVAVTTVALATWYLLPPLTDASVAAAAAVQSAASASGSAAGAPPPHSILHCCFRI
jgi:hypothetical protein